MKGIFNDVISQRSCFYDVISQKRFFNLFQTKRNQTKRSQTKRYEAIRSETKRSKRKGPRDAIITQERFFKSLNLKFNSFQSCLSFAICCSSEFVSSCRIIACQRFYLSLKFCFVIHDSSKLITKFLPCMPFVQ